MPIEHRIRTPERSAFRQLSLLSVGVCGLWLAHHVPTPISTAAVVAVSIVALGWATQVSVAKAFSDLHRVFRSLHLLGWTAIFSIAGILAVLPVATTRPFSHLFAHGQMTAEELADVGSLTGAMTLVGAAIITAIGSWDAFHDERHWYRSLGANERR